MIRNSILIVLVVGLIIGFGLGFLSGQHFSNTSSDGSTISTQSTFIPVGGSAVTGIIEQIQGNVITMNVASLSNEKSLTTFKITIDSKTQIVINQPKDPAVYASELKAYGKNFITSSPTAPPQSYTVKILKSGDLKVGETILAEAAADIKNATDFTATRISVIQAAVPTNPGSSSSTAPGALPAASLPS